MLVDVSATSPADWKYVSEGGSSIVFSYAGPASPYFSGTALRLRKSAIASGDVEVPHLDDTPQDEEPDDPTVVFQQQVTSRLIPAEYLPRLLCVKVTEPWLQQLHDISNEQRPEARRSKDQIAVKRTKAVLADDLVGGEGFVIEIKPKWGFIPSPTHLSPRSKQVKSRTCRFCMHAHLKSTDGEDVALGYCPLDLYSGDKARVTKAIYNLWDAWIGSSGQVNNLRVFINSQKLEPSSLPSSLSPLAAHLIDVANTEPSLTDLRDAFTSLLLPALLETPVLQKLSNLQRTLDPLDIEGLAALWSEAHISGNTQLQTALGTDTSQPSSIPPLGKGLAEPTLSDWDAFLDVYLNKHTSMDHDHPDVANLRYYCLAQLLSASFKDCSIMIHLKQPGSKPTIAVIDLDVKPIERLQKWALLDAEIVKAYEGIAEPTRCVDRWAI